MAKPNTTVRADVRGLYVRNDGMLFRPVLSRWSYAVFQPMYKNGDAHDPYAFAPDPALFVEGERVSARHRSETPYAIVQTADGRKAIWWSHGSYFKDGGTVPSVECWEPQT